MSYQLILGDINGFTKDYNGEPFDAVLTDAPYELGFMGKSWDKAGVSFNPATWQGIRQHLRPGSHMLCFGGTRTYHRIAVAIEDGGFLIRDCIGFAWMYGSGFPKNHNISKAVDSLLGNEREVVGYYPVTRDISGGSWANLHGKPNHAKTHSITAPASEEAETWDGYGTALKPSWEPVVLAMNPTEGTFAENALQHGVAGVNVTATKVGDEIISTTGRSDDKHVKSQSLGASWSGEVDNSPRVGRWPPNAILDEQSGKYIDSITGEAVSRFFYCAKAHRSERDAGLAGDYGTIDDGRNKPIDNPYLRGLVPRRNLHPTVKPIKLTRYLAKMLLPPDTGRPRRILVPFCGSGSEMIGAMLAGWDEIVGIDITEIDTARHRLEWWSKMSLELNTSDVEKILKFAFPSDTESEESNLNELPLFRFAASEESSGDNNQTEGNRGSS